MSERENEERGRQRERERERDREREVREEREGREFIGKRERKRDVAFGRATESGSERLRRRAGAGSGHCREAEKTKGETEYGEWAGEWVDD